MKTKFECGGCGETFDTSIEFVDHFRREGQNIVGCKKKSRENVSLKTNIN